MYVHNSKYLLCYTVNFLPILGILFMHIKTKKLQNKETEKMEFWQLKDTSNLL